MSENNTIQDSLRSTLHKVEGIEVSQHGPIKPLTTQMDTFNQPVVGQTQKSAFHHSRDWKSRQSTIPRKTLISKPVVVMNNNERRPTVFHSNETRPVKMFSTSEIESNNRINSVFSQNVPSPSNDVHSPLGDIRSINMLKTSSVTKQQLEQEQLKKRKQQELEKQRREQQERDRKQDAKKQEEYRLEQERLQLQREKEQREQRNREQQQREQRQREQQQREQRQREQQREQRQREQQQREQRQREQQQREQRQREQQQREQRQREQQQREQLNQRERLQRQRQLQSQNPTRHHSSTQLLVRPSHQSTPPRIFHVNRFPAMSRSTNVLNKLRRNSLRPRVTTTTTTTTTPAPVRVAPPILFSNPHQEQCVKPGAVFMSLKCDWLVRLMKGLCKNPILGRVCCADCKPVQPREPVCVDDIGCILTHSAQCYDRSKRSKCCATCKAFKTEHQGCEYGDRERHCDLFLQYMPDYTCDSFRNSCCLSCKSRIETTTVPPIEVMTTATWSENAWDHSFNTRQTFHHNDRNAMFNENPDVLHWNK
ncbi:putative mediator of RNA polymerase II transcription subunit 26 [Mizuhopecten yessoensis]|uniref:putative mediator of RNA polymerase II transcription subunit 26 n=1 Tax=Mizuhopecten yessoensis TaxID=6573 RepID=UPI000B45C452|nr:putative mediator of RNA polymerase II transcription subunit 26 [Mizuhopecten yessoensis]